MTSGRSAVSGDYFYGRGGGEMRSDRTSGGGRNYDGDAEQRSDYRRRSLKN